MPCLHQAPLQSRRRFVASARSRGRLSSSTSRDTRAERTRALQWKYRRDRTYGNPMPPRRSPHPLPVKPNAPMDIVSHLLLQSLPPCYNAPSCENSSPIPAPRYSPPCSKLPELAFPAYLTESALNFSLSSQPPTLSSPPYPIHLPHVQEATQISFARVFPIVISTDFLLTLYQALYPESF